MKMKATLALGTAAVLALAYPVAAQVPSGQAKPRPPAEAAAGPESANMVFVRRAAESGAKEVELGKLATDKASNEEVRAFGKQMVANHSKSNGELMALASMPPPSVPPKAEEDLTGLSGAAFDRAYMAKMVTDLWPPSNSSRPRCATARTTRSESGPLRSCRRFAAISRRRARSRAKWRRQPREDECARPASKSGAKGHGRRHQLAQGLDDQAFTQFPGVLDGGAACGVVEHTPYLLRGRNAADGRRKRRDCVLVIA